MGESTKAVCALVLIVSGSIAALAWRANNPDDTTWSLRIGGTVIAILALGVILLLHFRADLAHDYLRDYAGTYFNRHGFGFAVSVTSIDGIAYLDAYFQNQHANRCTARIALRHVPQSGIQLGTTFYDVECGPAAFGFARVAFAIPRQFQGTRHSFEVGADVQYPEGKGKRLRFHDGQFLRANANFGNQLVTVLTVAAAMGGAFFLSRPAKVTVQLPTGVAEDLAEQSVSEVRILWKLGDPSLVKGC
jgi:hypothetical protein